MPEIEDEKVIYVAAMAAQLIDNDQDGIIDDPKVYLAMKKHDTSMTIFERKRSKKNKKIV